LGPWEIPRELWEQGSRPAVALGEGHDDIDDADYVSPKAFRLCRNTLEEESVDRP
jgi:hypothetical protein